MTGIEKKHLVQKNEKGRDLQSGRLDWGLHLQCSHSSSCFWMPHDGMTVDGKSNDVERWRFRMLIVEVYVETAIRLDDDIEGGLARPTSGSVRH
jgi:hypothetical protein